MTWRPRVRSILLVVNLLILLLPLGGIMVMRLYDTELIRQTEAELIAQGAFVGAAFREALPDTLPPEYGAKALPRWVQPLDSEEPFAPVAAHLKLGSETIRPRPVEARPPVVPPDPIADLAGQRIMSIMKATRTVTLAGIRVVDFRGTVVASTRGELGLSLLGREEVQRALKGENVSLLRQRVTDEPNPSFTSIRRQSFVRVFVAMPVMEGDRVLGAVILSRSPMSVYKALYQNRQPLLGALGVLMAVVMLVTIITSTTIARPVQALIRQTEALSRGEKGAGAPLDRPVTHEIALLSDSFAEMARTLEARADYIRTFASNVSHEFKTPLASIRGTVELLRDHLDEMSPQERERFLTNLDDDASRLDRLVRRLLELARADVLEPADGSTPVREVVDRVVARFRSAGLEATVEHGPGVERARMQPETFESIVSNLLDNARQHGGEGVRVRVSTSMGPDGLLEVRVADDGPGVSAANAARVFAPFFTTARDKGGTGMGLSIVRSLVVAHGGEIGLEPGEKGAVFRVRVPSG